MIRFSSKLSRQIELLLESLDDSNSDAIFQELCECTSYGVDGSILVLQTCLNHMNAYDKDLNNMKPHALYAAFFKHILHKPNFSTVLDESLRPEALNEEFLHNLSGALQLSVSEKIGVGLALSDSENLDISLCGKSFCMGQITELCATSMCLESTDLIEHILVFLNQTEGLSKHVDSFMQMLSLVQLKEESQFVVAPFLPDDAHNDIFFRNFDLLTEDGEDDFDAILAEMEKEISMADMMSELGYGCTANVSLCKEMLSRFSPISEVTVAKILGTVVRTYACLDDHLNAFSTFCSAFALNPAPELPQPSCWNVKVLVDSIKQLAPGINWINVMEKLDQEGFHIPDESAFSLFMSIYKYACQDPFPLRVVCGFVWNNVEGQLSFLKHAVLVAPEVFTFVHSDRKLAYDDGVNAHTFQPGQMNHAWSCLDLLEVLCLLAERGHARSVLSILENPRKFCPEVLLLGMARVNTAYNLIQNEVTSAVIPVILKNSSWNSALLNLWHVNQKMLLRGLSDAMNFDPDNIFRVLDVCLELKIISQVVDMVPACFGIRLAVLASKREPMDFESWLSSNIVTYKLAFCQECLRFIKEVQEGAQDATNRYYLPGGLANFYLEACPIVIKALQSHSDVISSTYLSEEMDKLSVSYVGVNSRSKNGGSSDANSDVYGDDVEAEANSYFHQMFSGQLAVEEMVQKLARYKDSLEKRESRIFECMIANLFEEYKFFSKYPERQLKIAAVLFGSLIKHQLVNHITLGIALRAVLDAMRKPADSKMFVFGTKALEQFLDRLTEWPQYCNHILQISHMRASNPELVSYIERTLARISAAHAESDMVHNAAVDSQMSPIQSSSTNVEVQGSSFSLNGPGSSQASLQASSTMQPPQRLSSVDERKTSAMLSNFMKPALSSTGQHAAPGDSTSLQKAHTAVGLPSLHSSSSGFPRSARGFGSALNIETLVAAAERRETPIEAPASEIQDKISFLINNLSAQNFESKAKEFSEILNENYYPWFAQYLVMKRASIEPNFHDLYLKFLDKVSIKPLTKEIIQATYENCKVLLGSELIKSSVEERSLLKNLGSWLGKITIGKNQVLRAREIDPKSLIVEAYEKGLMIAVIPFTSKILEPCSSSVAYLPPNPWTMGILGLLAEIYAMPNLKMNLKFDIEVLFKNLGVDLKDVAPTSLLVDRVREVEGNPDFSNKDIGPSHQPTVNEVKPAILSARNQVEQPLDAVPPPHAVGHPRIIPPYTPSSHISPGILTDDEKLVSLGFSDQLPSQGMQSQFSVSQLPVPASNIEQQVVVNKKIQAIGLHLTFQSVLPIAMDRAVKEIVTSITQRSVSIATQTTKELVSKDYALEPDETLIRNAAHLMVARLAGSLAHVTCKEPLRVSISTQLRSLLQGTNMPVDTLEQAVQLVTNDNLDLGCVLIEQAATEKAVQTIDGDIALHLNSRRKHRESVGPAFYETSMYAQGQMVALPEALRPKPGQLSHSQQRVYEDFARFPGQNRSSQSSTLVAVGPSTSSSGGGLSRQLVSSGSISTGIYPSGLVNARNSSIPQTLEIGHEEMETNEAQIPSGPSTQFVVGDSPSAQMIDNEAVAPFSPTSTPELQVVEPSDPVKESGNTQQHINPTSASERLAINVSEPLLTTGDALDKYQAISEKLENLLSNDASEAEIQGVVDEVPAVILKCISRDEAALAVAQKAFKGLYENASNSAHVKAHLAILAAIRDVSKLVVKELTSWVIYSEEERKFNKDIIVGLIHSELLNVAEYNVHMAKLLDAGRNKSATEFAISLIQALVVSDSKVISELHNLVDALAKLASRPGSPESLQQLVEIAKNPATSSASLSTAVAVAKEENLSSSSDKKVTGVPGSSREDYVPTELADSDPTAFHEQVSELFSKWFQVCESRPNDADIGNYVSVLHQKGLLKGDEMSDRFFRRIMELSVSHCLSTEVMNSSSTQSHQGQQLSFLAIDIFAKLVYSVLKFCPVDQGSGKVSLLPKVLSVAVKFIQKDAEEKRASFNPRPYFRLFVNWLLDLCLLDPVFDGANLQVLIALANAFHAVQPLKVPGFSFAWLELVSHRSFMPKLLAANGQKGWPYFQRLLVDLFQFMEPFLRNAELGEPVHFLYKGTLRVLLVLLHDFPEFLCDYHFSFCDVIPPSCMQMRNIILSAFPRNMRLPDPSTPNLKIDLLAEISQSPRILSEVDAALKTKQMKSDVDEYLKTRQQGSSFLTELKQKLLLSPTEAARAGTRYNVPLINSLVLYIGMQAIQQLQARAPPHTQSIASMTVFLVSAALDIFQKLIMDLDTEGRYLFLNAVANQLRYPNNHTHYFSFVLLYLFAESNQEVIQEQITRVLLERLIVNRPHPWGLLITFIELIKNPRYNFWSRSFTRCAPEIEKLFESVSRSCGGPKPVDEVASGGIPDTMH